MNNKHEQQGFFLFVAVIFIVVMGFMGVLVAWLFSSRAQLSVAQANGLRAFYNAESALEIGARLLTQPTLTSRLACASIGTMANTALNGGTFTLSTINNSPLNAVNALASAIAASATVIPVVSTSGFAPSGRVVIDNEAIDYAGISGTNFIGVIRGSGSTIAAAHSSGSPVTQLQCSLAAKAGIPSLASANYQRELQRNIQLQDAWTTGAFVDSNFVFSRWNQPTEIAWNPVTLAGGSNVAALNSISLLGNAYGWAVGNAVSTNFTFARFNGASWSLQNLAGACSGQHLMGVSAVSVSEVWAVGVTFKPGNCTGGRNRYTVMRWNGNNWTQLAVNLLPVDNNSNNTLNAVHVIDTNADGVGDVGFAVGIGSDILLYNGSSWTRVASPATQNLYGVHLVSASEAWAVGANGIILRWNGNAWSSVTSPTTRQLNSVWMLDTNNDGLANLGWAVGANGTVLFYNGTAFSAQTSNTAADLLAVSGFNSRDVWAVGSGGTALHWNGSNWISGSAGTSANLLALAVVRSGQAVPVSSWQQVFN